MVLPHCLEGDQLLKCFGEVYKIVNKINSKIYVGQTRLGVKARFRMHINEARRGSNTLIHRAIAKYGADNFDVSVICECTDYQDLCDKEIYYIQFYNSFKPYGYNLTLGGDGVSGSDRGNKPVIQYDLSGRFIKEWYSIKNAAETLSLDRASISNCCNKKRFKQVGGFIWRFKTPNFSKYISPIKKHRVKYSATPVLKYSLEGTLLKEYVSISAAASDNNISMAIISNNCKGITEVPDKFIWRYSTDPLQSVPIRAKRRISDVNMEKLRSAVSKKTLQMDVLENVVKEHASAKAAAEYVGLHYDTIYKACRGQLKTAAGFYWKYKQED